MQYSNCVKSVQIRSNFWSVFSYIPTEYREILVISPYSVRMRENRDQKLLRIWTLFTQWSIRFWFSSKEINFENALLNVLLFLNPSKKFKILNDNNWAALIAPWFFISFLENSWVSGNANPWYTLSFSWEYQGLQIIIDFYAVAKTFALWLVK